MQSIDSNRNATQDQEAAAYLLAVYVVRVVVVKNFLGCGKGLRRCNTKKAS